MAEDIRNTWEDEEEEQVSKEPSKPFFQTLLGRIVIVILIFILIIITSIIVANIIFSMRIGSMEQEEGKFQESEDAVKLVENPKTYSLGDMNLNLERPGSYLSVEIFLAYDGENKNLRWELEQRRHHIIDEVRYILEDNKPEDIDTVEERNNKIKPKILNSINEILERGELYDIYFKTFTIQSSPVN